ncbi:MAG TPA: carboxylate--amine ligase/circularly permuted type 2 ATP-grasp protein [Polyangiaceae bacterium]|nr:carboxylate--amine ligase/circularly permuted type 2 ATP-grasp protein [Polyangiaceae bacterium]
MTRESLTLGVEEEFHLVDLTSRRLTPRASEILARLSAAGESPAGSYAAELQQSVVETNSAVTSSLSELREHLVALRSSLIATAESLGVGVAAAGTMPLCAPLTMTETPRFQRMLADYQLLVREQLICGMQVHVGISDRDLAVRLLERVSPWLPPLLALSVSSPFSRVGADTGYASSRSLIWSRWPTTGPAGSFGSAAEYDACVRDLVASGVISDPGMLYFDVRPSAHAPTIELRVCDSCPSVDTVILIAGLFRAVVAREIARLQAGERYRPAPAALQRAALWRAARSGLEGELVDLAGARPVPAGVLLRQLCEQLAPELDASGDRALVERQLDAALARGSSSARQREALRERSDVRDVVDLLLAETRGEAPAALGDASPLLASYPRRGYDEALQADARPRAAHAGVLSALCALGAPELRERARRLERELKAAGIVFRPSGEQHARALPLDLVPRVLSGEEWSRVQGGTAQRARALDAFLQDIYGEAAIVRDGVLPEWLVQRSPGYRQAGKAVPAGMRRAHVCGFDIIRDQDGRWLVLEDNLRVPSGVAYAVHARRSLRRVLPELVERQALLDPEPAPRLLRQLLEQSAPPRASSTPQLGLLSSGASDSAWFEHRFLAEAMDIPLLEPAELLFAEGRLWRVSGTARTGIDVLYLRMDEQVWHRRAADGKVLGGALLAAVRAGTLALANALGNGLGDDKAMYAYVPRFIEYYLRERPLLEQVPTYQCAEPDQLALVLQRLDQLVLKPVDGYGGLGVLIGPHASDAELSRARALIEQQPERWIAQEVVQLSTHPTLSGGRLRPRHIDLRVFVYHGAEPVVVPAALTRVAPPGSLVVNSSRGGGTKDTWLLQ